MSLATAANGSPSTAVASSSTSSQHQSGDVLLFSTSTLTVANVIQAHKSLSFLSINSTGSLLATSSDKGTVIRVWSIPGAEKLYEFRRGTREARIYPINFRPIMAIVKTEPGSVLLSWIFFKLFLCAFLFLCSVFFF
ncbi:hypothetical protein BYT27DRAFT_7187487 [Phlegmacium glaucopus]|nr:hypothetical protein BYT27DRAFT_7187487 [Phlegmacium glaucopus]